MYLAWIKALTDITPTGILLQTISAFKITVQNWTTCILNVTNYQYPFIIKIIVFLKINSVKANWCDIQCV